MKSNLKEKHKIYQKSIIVKLNDRYVYLNKEQFIESLNEEAIEQFKTIQANPEVQDFSPLITSISMEELKSFEKKALVKDKRKYPSLSSFWKINYEQTTDSTVQKITKQIKELSFIDYSYVDLIPFSARVEHVSPTVVLEQLYTRESRLGINAEYAWSKGILGQNVGVVVLEQEWLENHEDLTSFNPPLIHGKNLADKSGNNGYHGTATMGVLVADHNTKGINGIAPNVDKLQISSYYTGEDSIFNMPNALLATLANGNNGADGDIILVEAAYYATTLPIEVKLINQLAINILTALNRVVIVPAGNGDRNLDLMQSLDAPLRRLDVNGVDYFDTGSIFVGGSDGSNSHDKFDYSNYGSRVDCFSWADNVMSTGALTQTSISTNIYSDDFSGTSSASAIIAGAAALVQSFYIQEYGYLLNSYQMRDILKHPSTGTSSHQIPDPQIGVMPDLRKILGPYYGDLQVIS